MFRSIDTLPSSTNYENSDKSTKTHQTYMHCISTNCGAINALLLAPRAVYLETAGSGGFRVALLKGRKQVRCGGYEWSSNHSRPVDHKARACPESEDR